MLNSQIQGEEGTTTKMVVPQGRPPLMPTELYRAAMQGDGDALVQWLGLGVPDQERNHWEVQIDARQIDPQFDIRSTTNYGNTILHLLVTREHNELARKIFQKDKSLLKAQNRKLETPLHCAAKVGNNSIVLNLIELNSDAIKDALGITDDNGDTALHVGAKYNFSVDASLELMKLDPEVAYKVNKEGSCPLHIAIANKCDTLAIAMLTKDPMLAYLEDSDGMLPVHIVGRTGNMMLVKHFVKEYPNYVELLEMLDPRGRNVIHFAAEENQATFIWNLCGDKTLGELITKLNKATDYEGNTPLHIAALKGHKSFMKAIVKNKQHTDTEGVRNKQNLTPFDICKRQLLKIAEDSCTFIQLFNDYVESNGQTFTMDFFEEVMVQDKDLWQKVQVIGLGSVLITTVAFAAAITTPGLGGNQENGTRVFARRYMTKAFVLANAVAFITAFISLCVILNRSLSYINSRMLGYSSWLFHLAAGSMVVAFGLGVYVTFAPYNMFIAMLILIAALLIGSPIGAVFAILGEEFHKYLWDGNYFRLLVIAVLASYALVMLLIFGLAFT